MDLVLIDEKIAADIDSIRGIEGKVAQLYFGAFNALIRNNEFEFKGRSRRPPLDEVNDQLIKYLSSISFAITRINEFNRCKIWVNPEVYENLRTNPDTLVHLRKLGVTRWEYNAKPDD